MGGNFGGAYSNVPPPQSGRGKFWQDEDRRSMDLDTLLIITVDGTIEIITQYSKNFFGR